MSYKIAVLRQAYCPDLQGIERPYFLQSDDGQTDEQYDTAAEAISMIDTLDNDIYTTTNGESGRPEYIIVDANTDIGHDDMSNYNWETNDCTRNDGNACGECSQCIAMMIEQDREGIRNAEVAA